MAIVYATIPVMILALVIAVVPGIWATLSGAAGRWRTHAFTVVMPREREGLPKAA